jgi:hypothetical protein
MLKRRTRRYSNKIPPEEKSDALSLIPPKCLVSAHVSVTLTITFNDGVVLKNGIFWDVVPCTLVEVCRRSEVA